MAIAPWIAAHLGHRDHVIAKAPAANEACESFHVHRNR